MQALHDRLARHQKDHGVRGKGQLGVVLHVTRTARERGLPLDAVVMNTGKKGQVAGLGKGRIQSILKSHGIDRVLSEEGGRTSRGSLGNMQDYAAFLNDLQKQGLADLGAIEAWWIERVREFFNSKPFTLRFDAAKSLRHVVRDLLAQALKRQKEMPGATYAGTVLQHLVGAKLSILLPEASIEHHGASVADAPSSRSDDFVIDGVVLHVTLAPTEALMRKCQRNIDAGARPVIITTDDSRAAAEQLAKISGIESRVDVLEAEQFLAANIYEWSRFASSNCRLSVERLMARYNEIVADCETDPSLRVSLT